MKLESNNKLLGGSGGPNDGERRLEEPGEARANAEEIIDEILAEFSAPNRDLAASRTPANSLSERTLEDIDPSSDLGSSIRNKCLELEEILRSLKSRLNDVVLGENIVLSPDANSLEAQLEHDMDTDCQEDLSLQEFLQLLQTQGNSANFTVNATQSTNAPQ